MTYDAQRRPPASPRRVRTRLLGLAATTAASVLLAGAQGAAAQVPSLVVSQSASPNGTTQRAYVGEPLTYTVSVRNPAGVAASDVTITDVIPINSTLVSARTGTGDACSGSRQVVCDLGFVHPGVTKTATIVVRPSARGDIVNQVFVASGNFLDAESELITEIQPNEVIAAFDWSLPDRARDDDRNGLVDMGRPPGGWRPTSFPVRLDACASSGGKERVVSYRWQIEGQPTQTTSDCALPITVDEEGLYTVTVTTTTDGGRTDAVTRQVGVQDRVIVALGDSYGSGEGNPDVPIQYGASSVLRQPEWNDRRCHRSAHAASAKAALAIERADAHSSVTYISRACSGATINAGIIQPYAGVDPHDPAHPIPPQISQVEDLLGDRLIDDLVISVGGNDIGFAKIIADCLLPGLCQENFELVQDFDRALSGLGDIYAEMRRQLTVKLRVAKTYITEYPDFTTNRSGARCDVVGEDVLAPLTGILRSEADWAATYVLPRLNQGLRNQVTQARQAGFDWHYVDGVSAAFTIPGQHGHGYCVGTPGDGSTERWVRTFVDACWRQGPAVSVWNGTPSCDPLANTGQFHPNEHGHAAIGERQTAALRANPPAFDYIPPPEPEPKDDEKPQPVVEDPAKPFVGANLAAAIAASPPPPPVAGPAVTAPVALKRTAPARRTAAGRCAKLKGHKRSTCVRKACAKHRKRRTAAGRRKYRSCVRAVTAPARQVKARTAR